MIGKREINNLSFDEINAAIWKDRQVNELVSLTDVFTVDALFYMVEHPDWDRFPNHFKDWVRNTVDLVLSE